MNQYGINLSRFMSVHTTISQAVQVWNKLYWHIQIESLCLRGTCNVMVLEAVAKQEPPNRECVKRCRAKKKTSGDLPQKDKNKQLKTRQKKELEAKKKKPIGLLKKGQPKIRKIVSTTRVKSEIMKKLVIAQEMKTKQRAANARIVVVSRLNQSLLQNNEARQQSKKQERCSALIMPD